MDLTETTREMIKKVILLILLFMGNLSTPSEGLKKLYYWYGGKKIFVPLKKHGEIWVTEKCAKKPSICKALTALRTIPEIKSLRNVTEGNYAGSYCKLQGGLVIILIDDTEYQYEYCAFPDRSMIDAWALYRTYPWKRAQ